MPFENLQRLQTHRDSGPGLDKNTVLAGDFIYFDPWSCHEISREEAGEYRHAPLRIPEDHPRGFVDADSYYQTYAKGDPMVDNEPVPPAYTARDGGIAGEDGDSPSDKAMVAPASLPAPPAAAFRDVTLSVSLM